MVGIPLLVTFVMGPFYFSHRLLKKRNPKWYTYFTLVPLINTLFTALFYFSIENKLDTIFAFDFGIAFSFYSMTTFLFFAVAMVIGGISWLCVLFLSPKIENH